MIELEIFYIQDEMAHLQSLGIDVSEDSTFLKKHTFLNIDNIAPYKVDDKYHTLIISGGERYIANISYEDLRVVLWNTYFKPKDEPPQPSVFYRGL